MVTLDKLNILVDGTSPVLFKGCMHEKRVALLDWTMEWMSLAVGWHDWLYGIAATDQGELSLSTVSRLRNKTFPSIHQYSRVRRDLWISSLKCPPCKEKRAYAREHPLFKNMDRGLVINRPGEKVKNGDDDGETMEPREVDEVGDVSGGEEEPLPDL